jgi:hypothetical protein
MPRPILSATIDKVAGSCDAYDTVPEAEIIKSLEPYGITSKMLPSHMGESVQLDGAAWIAN